jgi:hypothetical protein
MLRWVKSNPESRTMKRKEEARTKDHATFGTGVSHMCRLFQAQTRRRQENDKLFMKKIKERSERKPGRGMIDRRDDATKPQRMNGKGTRKTVRNEPFLPSKRTP